jgi:hypothetical protein
MLQANLNAIREAIARAQNDVAHLQSVFAEDVEGIDTDSLKCCIDEAMAQMRMLELRIHATKPGPTQESWPVERAIRQLQILRDVMVRLRIESVGDSEQAETIIQVEAILIIALTGLGTLLMSTQR